MLNPRNPKAMVVDGEPMRALDDSRKKCKAETLEGLRVLVL